MANWWINDSGQNTLKGEPAYVAQDGTVLSNQLEAQQYSVLYNQSYSVWLDDGGNPGNPRNPIRMRDDFVLHCIHTVPQAREDFFKMLPSLNPAEQARFNRMLERSPLHQVPYVDPTTTEDNFARRMNRAGIRTTGPKGGTRIGG